LKVTFSHGEETGVKTNPADIASKLTSLRSAKGNKSFVYKEGMAFNTLSKIFQQAVSA